MRIPVPRLLPLYLIYTFSILPVTRGEFEAKVDQYCDKFLLNNSRNCRRLTDYYLYVKPYQSEYRLNTDKHSVRYAPFTPNVPIKIILHGFNESYRSTPNKEIRPEYLHEGYNVISADFSQYVQYPCYRVAAYNVRILGECFGKFLKYMLRTKVEARKIDKTDLHVIGYNLGAQIAGKGSKTLRKNNRLRRFTALDPILPIFYDEDNYVCPECADFVDVIHTNTKMRKKLKHLGHVDFYFNNPLFTKDVSITNPRCFTSSSPRYFGESISEVPYYRNSNAYLSGSKVIVGEWTSYETRGVYGVYTTNDSVDKYSSLPSSKKIIGVYKISNLEISDKT
nr:pancreatic lipase-related protein 2-like isoform X3 [Onthophagus taurus]